MSVLPSSFWHLKGRHVVLQELHHFADGFVVGLSFDLGELLDGKLGRNLSDCLWILSHRGDFNVRAAAST